MIFCKHALNLLLQGGKNLLQLAVELAERKPEITNCCRILQDYKNTNVSYHYPLIIYISLTF